MDAVILHPHPDMGGNQRNPVVQALAAAFAGAGITPHTFDFTTADAHARTLAAIEAAAAPVLLAGYSFGGGVASEIDHEAIVGWCLVAPALSMFTPVIGPDPRPKHVIAAEHDGWFGPAVCAASTAHWTATSHATLPGTDHFFPGRATAAAAEALRWVQQLP